MDSLRTEGKLLVVDHEVLKVTFELGFEVVLSLYFTFRYVRSS